MNYKSLIIVVLTGFFLWECSTPLPEVREIKKTESSVYKNDMKINSKRIYVWVNKMPGVGSKPRLHATGELDFFEDTHYNLKNIEIKKVSILQNNEIIYMFSPSTEVKFEKNKKVILFSTVKGLLLSSQLDTKKKITLKILLSDGEEEINFFISDVEIHEVF